MINKHFYKNLILQFICCICVLGNMLLLSAAAENDDIGKRFGNTYSIKIYHRELALDSGGAENIEKVYFASYDKLLARWGNGSESKHIEVYLCTSETYGSDTPGSIAYVTNGKIYVLLDHLLREPDDCSYITHELTHIVQHYNGFQSTWWTENMANYAQFRYFRWLDEDTVYNYFHKDHMIRDWGYEPYGRAEWFFAYLDERYPTTQDENEEITYGLIDSLHFAIQKGKIKTDGGREHTDTAFNAVVKRITGYANIEELRGKYVQELNNGTWVFDGFDDYPDNFLTKEKGEKYPMIITTEKGKKTSVRNQEIITKGVNLCADAVISACSGYINDNEQADMLIDGKAATKWCAAVQDVQDSKYLLKGVPHYIIIDLGKSKEFDKYTILHAGTREHESYNTGSWEVLISKNGKKWTSVDYQSGNQENQGTYEIGDTKSRYVMLKVWDPDENVGTVRIYEFMLWGKEGKETEIEVTPVGLWPGTVLLSPDSRYRVNADGKTLTYEKLIKGIESVNIPETIEVNGNSYPVTAIGNKAFANKKKLKQITITKNITSIGKKAFYNCKKLKSITIKSKKLTLEKVGANAFGKIYAKVMVKVPKTRVTSYKKLLRMRGVSKKAKVL